MLRVNKSRQVWWPAKIAVPEDGGKTTVFQVELHVKIPTVDAASQGDRELVEKHVIGWENVADEAGNALPFTAENLSAVLDVPYIQAGFAAAIVQCARGVPAKN